MDYSKENAAIFLTDYASYNDGSQFEFGHWVYLKDFEDAEELNEYIKKHFEKCDAIAPLDSPREEIMITDYEGFPESMYSESSMNFEELFTFFEIFEDINSPSDWLSLHNEWASEIGSEEIYENDEEFFNMFFADKPFDAVKATFFGDYRYSDDLVKFDGYGNLESFDKSELEDEISEQELIDWKIQQILA